MSVPESNSPQKHEGFRQLMDGFAEDLAQVLETMADQKPGVGWQPAAAAPSGADILWWEQRFPVAPEAAVWIGSPAATWEYAGGLALKAAGLEEVPEGEAKKTWIEIIGQWLGSLARSLGPLLGREVVCGAAEEKAPADDGLEWMEVSLAFGEAAVAPLSVAFSAPLLAWLTAPPAPEKAPQKTDDEPAAEGEPDALPVPASRTLDLLLDVELPVSISFGKTHLPLKDVIKLTTGSIVELNRGLNDPVEVLINHSLVARGEVVVVDGNYGVRIQHIVSRQDRLRSLH